MSGLKTSRRILASTAVIALAVGVTLASGSGANAAGSQPVTGGTLYFITHDDQFDHIDPARVYTGRDIAFLNSYLFRNLVSYKPVAGSAGSSLVADLATNTGVPSNAAKTWKFTLRSGITWEDGSPVTCADVKYGVSRPFATDVITDGPQYLVQALAIPTNADGTSQYKGPYKKTGQALFDKAVTCSGNTVTFNLNRSFADFNYALTYPAGAPVKASKDTGDKYELRPFSNGPYKITSYKIGDQMALERNAAWKKSSDPVRTPYPDNIVVRFGLAEDVRDQIMLEDQIPNTVSLDGMQPANMRAFFADPTKKDQRFNVYDPYVRFAAMNTSAGHMDCLDVRKAVFFAINTQALIDLSGGREYYGDPGDSPIKPVLGLDYAKTTGNIHDSNWSINGNPTYAASVLAKAKTSCPATYDKATNPDKGIVWDLSQSATNQKASVLLGDALKAAGIVVKFNFIPGGQYYATVQNNAKQNDISTAGWGADWANASTVIPELFIKGHGFNLTQNWNDPAYPAFAKKSDAALNETNRAKQAKMWQELSQVVMDNYWIIRPIFNKAQDEWGSKVGGVYYWEPQGTFGFGGLYVKN
ncbi:MAG: ABC transporter substrate-binding protein [Actinomycetota bacterium]|jgi:peptide/nickel transport system substrate-binding protein